MASPTSRTLSHLRAQGYMAGVVEFWNPHTNTRRDLFGFLDVVAVREGEVLGVQATSTGGASRVNKILNDCTGDAILWLEAGTHLQVIGWKKYKKAVNRKWWRPRIWDITLVGGELVAEVRK